MQHLAPLLLLGGRQLVREVLRACRAARVS
jgi:hypothetical protein